MTITIDKAIELLTQLSSDGREQLELDFQDAIKLGIEALKRIKAHRPYGYPGLNFPLPGETEQ